MRGLVLRLAAVVALAASATSGSATPVAAPAAVQVQELALAQPVQFIYLGRPYCWYPYGWAGAGWYWCGYGTRVGFGWGGPYGWNGWVVPRGYRAARIPPGSRFRPYR